MYSAYPTLHETIGAEAVFVMYLITSKADQMSSPFLETRAKCPQR